MYNYPKCSRCSKHAFRHLILFNVYLRCVVDIFLCNNCFSWAFENDQILLSLSLSPSFSYVLFTVHSTSLSFCHFLWLPLNIHLLASSFVPFFIPITFSAPQYSWTVLSWLKLLANGAMIKSNEHQIQILLLQKAQMHTFTNIYFIDYLISNFLMVRFTITIDKEISLLNVKVGQKIMLRF